jgi:SNF2 family DNA or RNA helicase
MRFVSPDEYPSKWAWLDRYAQMTPNVFSGGFDVIGLREDRREELDKFFLPRFIRRTKAKVLPDLPPKIYERRDVALIGKQRKAYDQLEKEMIAAVEGGDIVATNGLTAALRLRQLASAYGEVRSMADWKGMNLGDEKLHEAIDTQVRLADPSSKLDVMEEVLEELGPKQAVIFAESRQLIELAANRLDEKDYVFVTGAVTGEERESNINAFQKGEVKYLLATVAAGGEGITLTAADTAIFLQRPWSAVLSKQAEDRLHRIGQTGESVTYIDLVATDTIEEKVFDALARKEGRLQQLTGDEAAA